MTVHWHRRVAKLFLALLVAWLQGWQWNLILWLFHQCYQEVDIWWLRVNGLPWNDFSSCTSIQQVQNWAWYTLQLLNISMLSQHCHCEHVSMQPHRATSMSVDSSVSLINQHIREWLTALWLRHTAPPRWKSLLTQELKMHVIQSKLSCSQKPCYNWWATLFGISFNEMERLSWIHSQVMAELSTRYNSPEAAALQQSIALSGNNKVHVCITIVSALIRAHQSSEFKTLLWGLKAFCV